MVFLLNTEDSTDESEREEEEYEQLTAHYGALVRSALPAVLDYSPDLEALPDECKGGGGSSAQAADWPSAPRRLYFCGFGPVLTAWDIYEFLAQFGTVEAFRLYTDPATTMSLRAAGVLYEDANDAARALEATSDGMVYLANVWAPEAQMVADPGGELARSQYEAAVHHPVPPLLPPQSDGRNGFGMSGRAVGGYGGANGGGTDGGALSLGKGILMHHDDWRSASLTSTSSPQSPRTVDARSSLCASCLRVRRRWV